MVTKMFVSIFMIVGVAVGLSYWQSENQKRDTEESIKQFDEHNRDQLTQNHFARNNVVIGAWAAVLFINILMWAGEFKKNARASVGLMLMLLLSISGCRRQFEPIKLEMIEPNEVGFLISNSNVNDQKSTSAEEFTKNMVSSQQVKIPQMWVSLGYETIFHNGEWRDAARLIKVDTASVTREWTADPNSGTSEKNEAIWVMTSDQVEFSTGWTCTAKIASREDAAKFLSNYRNGTLSQVMDQELRAKIQSTFGLAVTDLPMDTLKKAATPIIVQVTTEVKTFFSERGITVTNIGITGGFVYKDPKIIAKMTEVFTAEQEKNIATAKSVAQAETNKTIQLEADAKAKATLTVLQAEADGIQKIADAKAYEIEKAQENKEIYLELKKLENVKAGLDKWDGKYPVYMFSAGGESTNLLLQMPAAE